MLIILFLLKKLWQILKLPSLNGRVRITNYKNIFSKDYTENWSREILIIDSVLKTNPSNYKIKDLNGKKNNSKLLWKRQLLSKL